MTITLVVDNVRSKENVGALFRTADGVGVGNVVLCGIAPCPVNRFGAKDAKVAKAALGAEDVVPWHHVARTKDVVLSLKEKGIYIIALEQAPSAVNLFSKEVSKVITHKQSRDVALIVGNEVDGISADVLAHADMVVYIPMHGKKEELIKKM